MKTLADAAKTKYEQTVKTETYNKKGANSLVWAKVKNRKATVEDEKLLDLPTGEVLIIVGKETLNHMGAYSTAIKKFAQYNAHKGDVTEREAQNALRTMLEQGAPIWEGMKETYKIGYALLDASGYKQETTVSEEAKLLDKALRSGDTKAQAEVIAALIKTNPELAKALQIEQEPTAAIGAAMDAAFSL